MKKKILISAVLVIMILSVSLMAFAGCKTKFEEEPLNPNFAIPKAEIGKNSGQLDDSAVKGGIKPINSEMSAYQMLTTGMDNFYNANYATIEYNGGVFMTLMGFINVEQVVQSTKIRQGVGDAAGNNANGATYFADNKSHSMFAQIYEKFVIRPDSWQRKAVASKKAGDKDNGSVDYTKPGRKGAGRLGAWSVDKWGAVKNYENLSTLVKVNSNNPTILWMYDLQEEFIKEKVDPVYVEEEKSYKFSFKFLPKESTVEYVKVMKVQLETNAGMPIDGLEFQQLILEVTMWENGMIRSINVNEVYQMKMVLAGTKIDSAVKLTATQLFSYDPNEEGYKIADHLSKF